MSHPKNLESHLFTYNLPEGKIAQFPLENRDQSKLLIFHRNIISEDVYASLSRYLPERSLLILNNTMVIHARLLFQKTSGGIVEIFLLEPANEDGYLSLSSHNLGATRWKCLIGGASKWKHGQVMLKQLSIQNMQTTLSAKIAGRENESFIIEFSWNPAQFSFQEILEQAGSVPIPPYLKRGATQNDQERYQTIYASRHGSVAAPTAGLHFTEKIFSSLAEKHIHTAYTTLHVGAGTFIPVKSTTLEGHTMHAEEIQFDTAFLQKLIDHNNQVFAVGTTSLRTIESLYWMGSKCILDPGISKEDLVVKQWDAYEMEQSPAIDANMALASLQQWMINKDLFTLTIKTQLLIAPPYRPKIANGLITNFHQPASTLLLLVAAVTNNKWRELYDYALVHDFRFLSYGDGCLLFFD